MFFINSTLRYFQILEILESLFLACILAWLFFFLSSCDSQFVDGQPFVYNGIQHSAIEATCCTEILQLFPR